MSQEEKNRYSTSELAEFEALINEKLDKARIELNDLKKSLTRSDETGTDATTTSPKMLEDGADTLEKERLNQLAAHQQKFIKERLRAVPHTMHSIEAKLAKR